MCSCSWDFVCPSCRDTRRDPAYLDTDDCEQPETELVRPAEFEVRE